MIIFNCPVCNSSASLTFVNGGYHIGCDNSKCILHKRENKIFTLSKDAVSVWNSAVQDGDFCEFCEYYNENEGNCGAFVCDGISCPELPCEKECHE